MSEYLEWFDEDDDTDARVHQMELEEMRYAEEWEREYWRWLRFQYEWWMQMRQIQDEPWWKMQDSDQKFIEEQQQRMK
jgi:hypothetical protein